MPLWLFSGSKFKTKSFSNFLLSMNCHVCVQPNRGGKFERFSFKGFTNISCVLLAQTFSREFHEWNYRWVSAPQLHWFETTVEFWIFNSQIMDHSILLRCDNLNAHKLREKRFRFLCCPKWGNERARHMWHILLRAEKTQIGFIGRSVADGNINDLNSRATGTNMTKVDS